MEMKTSTIFEKNLLAYDAGKRLIINQGGTSCFAGEQLVITKRGSIPIRDVVTGDFIKSYNKITGASEWKRVKNLFSYKNIKPTVRVKLKNGSEIVATEDHQIYYEGGCDTLKHILSLKYNQL
jgi:hypothetical protein